VHGTRHAANAEEEQLGHGFTLLERRASVPDFARIDSAATDGHACFNRDRPHLVERLEILAARSYGFRVFRPCIDLHEGKVKQIVGGTLRDSPGEVRTNFVSDRSSAEFAALYRRDGLRGGHVISLGPGNEEAAHAALAAYPGGLQLGGGVNLGNASRWLAAGASHVIVTSWVFQGGRVDFERLASLVQLVGRQRLVIDLSCRRRDGEYFVVTDRWQKFTQVTLTPETLARLAESCSEFLVHAVDVEGLCRGIDTELVELLAECSPIPTTYAGGANSLSDLALVTRLGRGRVDLTIGSALDIFGGKGVRYEDAVAFNRGAAAAGTQ
jgi:phosphoribosylformimino-5-aminoimidazole carboxamide ribotide isomerase